MQRTILNNFDSNSNAQVFRTIIKIAYFFDFYKFFEQKKKRHFFVPPSLFD